MLTNEPCKYRIRSVECRTGVRGRSGLSARIFFGRAGNALADAAVRDSRAALAALSGAGEMRLVLLPGAMSCASSRTCQLHEFARDRTRRAEHHLRLTSMVNGAWSRQLESQFLREVFTIRQAGAMSACLADLDLIRSATEGQSDAAAAAEAHASADARILRMDSPGTFSSMR